MSAVESLVVALLENMIDEHQARPETRAFPMDESIERNPANMIWNVGLNAMAYGLEAGLRFSGLTPDDLEVQIVNDQKKEVS